MKSKVLQSAFDKHIKNLIVNTYQDGYRDGYKNGYDSTIKQFIAHGFENDQQKYLCDLFDKEKEMGRLEMIVQLINNGIITIRCGAEQLDITVGELKAKIESLPGGIKRR